MWAAGEQEGRSSAESARSVRFALARASWCAIKLIGRAPSGLEDMALMTETQHQHRDFDVPSLAGHVAAEHPCAPVVLSHDPARRGSARPVASFEERR